MPYAREIRDADGPPDSSGAAMIQRARALFLPDEYGPWVGGCQDDIPSFAQTRAMGDRVCHALVSSSYDDDMVPVEHGRELFRILRDMGLEVAYKENIVGVTSPPHWVAEPKGIGDIFHFIEDSLLRVRHFKVYGTGFD